MPGGRGLSSHLRRQTQRMPRRQGGAKQEIHIKQQASAWRLSARRETRGQGGAKRPVTRPSRASASCSGRSATWGVSEVSTQQSRARVSRALCFYI
jgi:hypothetical protein